MRKWEDQAQLSEALISMKAVRLGGTKVNSVRWLEAPPLDSSVRLHLQWSSTGGAWRTDMVESYDSGRVSKFTKGHKGLSQCGSIETKDC